MCRVAGQDDHQRPRRVREHGDRTSWERGGSQDIWPPTIILAVALMGRGKKG